MRNSTFRMRRRTRSTLFIVAILLVLLAALIYLRGKAPPEAARLLPESDGILYVDLAPLRLATHFDQHPVPHDAAYQRFIDATGFVFERDLNEAAFALHRMANPLGPNGPVAFSEVFVGHFDRKRLIAYLQQVSQGGDQSGSQSGGQGGSQGGSQEQYAGHTIFNLPSDGRTVRVTLLGYDMVAVSNTPTPEQIHAILDRYRTAALPFSGSSVLGQYYGEVPALSVAWGIGKISLPLSGGPRVLGLRIPINPDTAFVASLRYLGTLKLRIEEIAPNDIEAAATATTLRTLLGLAAAGENTLPASMANADYRQLLNSVQVEQKGDRAVLSATLPINLLEKIVAPAAGLGPLATPNAPTSAPPPPTEPQPSPPGRHSAHARRSSGWRNQ
ncbi:MAG: hypothetical protein ACR2JE_15620 [Acidobacteriaceae bacterium]